MTAFLRAAAAYFILVFAARFAMGYAQALWLAPQMGALVAAGITLAVTLVVAWFASWLFCRLFDVPAFLGPRLLMGAIAFVLLVLAEARGLLHGQTVADLIAGYVTPAGRLNMVAQLAFALIPAAQARVLGKRPTV